jgi:hypothetical protein
VGLVPGSSVGEAAARSSGAGEGTEGRRLDPALRGAGSKPRRIWPLAGRPTVLGRQRRRLLASGTCRPPRCVRSSDLVNPRATPRQSGGQPRHGSTTSDRADDRLSWHYFGVQPPISQPVDGCL